MTHGLVRRPVALAAGLLAGVLAVPAAAAADPAPTQSFYADSGDACPYGATKGTLTWQTDTATMSVDVAGEVADQPTSLAGSETCADDGYDSTASFTLYDGSTVLDSASETVDNGTATFDVTLNGRPTSTSPINSVTVVVQVCRAPVKTLPPSYCGKPVTYGPPVA